MFYFNNVKCKDPLKISPYHIDHYDDFCKMHYENGKLLKAKMKSLLKEMQQFLDPPFPPFPPLEKVEPKDHPDFCTSFEKSGKVEEKSGKVEEKSGKVEPNDVSLYKLLCDDIYICLQTFNTRHGAMYSCARQTSQGAQRSYSATYTPRVDKGNDFNNITSFRNGGPPKFMRSYAFHSTSPSISPTPFPDFTDDDINLKSLVDNDNVEYTVSDQIDNPYSTLSILELMRSCSASIDEK
jgi:hypothetical protein